MWDYPGMVERARQRKLLDPADLAVLERRLSAFQRLLQSG
jgi:hypothetical protein